MSDFVIMTDSSCDLPAALADEMELTVLPLYVDVDGQKYTNYLDEREIAFSDIYAKLRTKCPAKTSSVNMLDFMEPMESLLSAGKERSQCRCGWNIGIREHKPHDGYEPEGCLNASGRAVLKGSTVLRDEWADTYHMRAYLLHKPEVLHKVLRGLPGASNHHSHAGFVAKAFKFPDTRQAAFQPHSCGVEAGVMFWICGLVTEEVPVCASFL